MSCIEVTGLVRTYGPTRAVRGMDLSIAQGELYGLIGPDGAGKTTTISCVAGLLDPTAGTVRVLGHDPLRGGSHVRRRLGLMPQEYSLYGEAYESRRAQLRSGEATATDLLSAELQLSRARLAELDAEVDLREAMARVRRAAGRLR